MNRPPSVNRASRAAGGRGSRAYGAPDEIVKPARAAVLQSSTAVLYALVASRWPAVRECGGEQEELTPKLHLVDGRQNGSGYIIGHRMNIVGRDSRCKGISRALRASLAANYHNHFAAETLAGNEKGETKTLNSIAPKSKIQ
ncbi:hypothetical protein EVAR_40684_1 [Eumeta japonica]|uniref:Uncharacterized protein n=1 Tax=Eumeta variegata TaxID=151549 RepID=A0A4C1XAF2_EUMVA|nr:hypothetical protein EVAR_40684_1 [Eumeta japonica]